jgi:hypothetical protein
MSDGGVVRTLSDSDLPMCPNGMLRPIHEAHQLHTRMIDALYEATKPYENEDGELPEPLDKASTALSYGPTTADRMHLYFDRVGFMQGREHVMVEAWYFRCAICGLMLPAQRVADR